MNNHKQLLNLIGLAQRAGKLISGEELVVKSIQTAQARLIFLAEDAAPNLSKKITDKAAYYNVPLSTMLSALEMSMAVGKPRKVIAVTDAGFVKKMRSMME